MHGSLLAAIADPLFLAGPDWCYTFVNHPWTEHFGLTADEALGRTVWECFPGILGTHLEHNYRRVMRERVAVTFERFSPATGRWYEVRAFPAGDGIGVLLVDITDRILDHAHVLIHDFAGQIAFWNGGAEKMYGWTSAEARGQDAHALLRTDFPKPLPEIMADLSAAGSWEGELSQRRKDGSPVVVASHWTLHKWDHVGPTTVMVVNNDITARKQIEDELQRVHDELEVRVRERTAELVAANSTLAAEVERRERSEGERQRLALRLSAVEEEERRRIARDLHDHLGQYLTALSVGLKVVQDDIPFDSPVQHRLAELRRMCGVLGREVRRLIAEIRPPVLDDGGLSRAVGSLVVEWAATAGVEVDYHHDGLADALLPPVVEAAAYRLVQEALTNVLKHAAAGKVSVVVRRTGDQLHVAVEDNGRGFDAERALAHGRGVPGRYGLLGMYERVAQLGGTLAVESRPSQGTAVIARLPLLIVGTGGR